MVEPVEGSEFSRVTLTEKAVERLDIQTAPVSMGQMDGSEYKVIPYAAVLYGLEGETWAYTTNPTSRIMFDKISLLITLMAIWHI